MVMLLYMSASLGARHLQLCRYITRPALANERVQTNAAGQVVLKLKTPWRDGTTCLVMSSLAFMQPSIERSVCGGQIRWFYVCRGSDRDSQPPELTALLLTAK